MIISIEREFRVQLPNELQELNRLNITSGKAIKQTIQNKRSFLIYRVFEEPGIKVRNSPADSMDKKFGFVIENQIVQELDLRVGDILTIKQHGDLLVLTRE